MSTHHLGALKGLASAMDMKFKLEFKPLDNQQDTRAWFSADAGHWGIAKVPRQKISSVKVLMLNSQKVYNSA